MARFQRTAFISLGYVCAVAVATASTLFLMTISALTPVSASGILDGIGMGMVLGVMITFPTALPGFIVALCIATSLKWRNWLPFSLAGTLNVLPAILLLELFMGGSPPGSLLRELPYYCLPGGFLGGLTFWLVAYRSVDAWPRGAKA